MAGEAGVNIGSHVSRDMAVEDAIELGRRAIYHATFRDAVSGGTVSGESAPAKVLTAVLRSSAITLCGLSMPEACCGISISLNSVPL